MSSPLKQQLLQSKRLSRNGAQLFYKLMNFIDVQFIIDQYCCNLLLDPEFRIKAEHPHTTVPMNTKNMIMAKSTATPMATINHFLLGDVLDGGM